VKRKDAQFLNLERAVEIVVRASKMLKMVIIFENFSEAVLAQYGEEKFSKIINRFGILGTRNRFRLLFLG